MHDSEISDRARRLHGECVVVDLHADTPSECFLDEGYDFGERHDTGHVDLPRLRECGSGVQFLIAWVPAEMAAMPGASFHHANALVDAIHRVVARTPGVRLATDAAGIRAARDAGDVAAMIGVEGGHAIENSLERLRELHARGARYLTLTWNNTNDWADAAGDSPRHGGLTAFGREVVRELNRLRMLVDVSHVAESTFWDALDASSAPVVATHSNAFRLAEHHRNLSDDQLRAVADTGGVIGVNAFPAFLDTAYGAAYERIAADAAALEARLRTELGDAVRARQHARAWRDRELAALPPVPLAALADHVEHIAHTAGIEHVALGCDFDGIPTTPLDLPHIGALPRLTELLLRRGWSDDDIRRLLGGNALRVLSTVLG
ncbi:MAG TPA: dipeptidase [Longimicrobiales bacterium]